jgi:DNA-binding XRE family transcriptional regulator
MKTQLIRQLVVFEDHFKEFRKSILNRKKTRTMDKKELKQNNLTPIEDLITEDFGAIGTQGREQFDMECDAFIIGEQLKDERLRAGLTQEQLADKIGTKKSFISRVERGHTDIQLSTLVKLFQGLGRKVSVRVI